jgi:RNA polymerase sigma factor (TIGR02999 family)
VEHKGDVTRLLEAWGGGDYAALDRLVPLIYEDLRRLARRHMRGERAGHTLQTTALVHEAFLDLARLDRIRWQDRSHFFAIAARAMRRVLVDHAERRNAQKRGSGRQPIPLNDAALVAEEEVEEILAVHEALTRLERLNERHCRVVECRVFGGLGVEETAEAMGISTATVKRDWAAARAWLNRELVE